MRRWVAFLVVSSAAFVLAGLAVEGASADLTIDDYFTGTLTENYHNFGSCHYSIASDCSGNNYWVWSQAFLASTNGSNLVAVENDSTIRGDFMNWSGVIGLRVYASAKGMGGWYIRGSVTLWTATLTDVDVASVCVETDCS